MTDKEIGRDFTVWIAHFSELYFPLFGNIYVFSFFILNIQNSSFYNKCDIDTEYLLIFRCQKLVIKVFFFLFFIPTNQIEPFNIVQVISINSNPYHGKNGSFYHIFNQLFKPTYKIKEEKSQWFQVEKIIIKY